MVLTRAQAAVQAANQDANQTAIQVHESSTETATVEHPRSAQVQFIEQFLSTNDQLASFAQQLIAQTQTLATGQAMLHYQHQDQSDAHRAALVAVQQSSSPPSQVLSSSDQQRVIAEIIGEALVATQTELQEQLQRLQVVDGERVTQIEHYVNEKFGLALQEVQRETHDSQLAIASQTERVRLRVEAIENEKIAALRGDMDPEQNAALVKSMATQASAAAAADIKIALEAELHRCQLTIASQTEAIDSKIASSLDAITSRIPQIVEEMIAASQEDKGPDQNAALVEAMVAAASATAAADMKKTHEAELHLIHEEMQIKERQLEARVQRELTNLQVETNLQVQRQADAISILREQSTRSSNQSGQLNEAVIASLVKEAVRREVDLLVKSEQVEDHAHQANRSDTTRDSFAAQINDTIERNIQAAAIKIDTAIQNGMRDLDTRIGYLYGNQQLMLEDNSDGDSEMSAEELRMERRMQDAWRKTYIDAKSPTLHSKSEDSLSPGEDHGEKVAVEGIQTARCQALEQPTAQHQCYCNSDASRGTGVASETLTPPPPPPAEQHQFRHFNPQPRSDDLRQLVSELQQQAAERAELAAQRWASKKK